MLVLASQSASRKAMLSAAGVKFEARAADVDERALEAELVGADAPIVALALAKAKALAGSEANPGALVLGSDSMVEVEGRRFNKPRHLGEAAEHLRFFSGKTMVLHSAAALARDGEVLWSHADKALLTIRPLSESFIAGYLADEWPEVGACVGVFRIEGLGVQLFEKIEGSQFTVLGMPLLPVLGALRDAGVMQP